MVELNKNNIKAAETRNLSPLPHEGDAGLGRAHSATPTTPAAITPTSPPPHLLRSRSAATASSPSRYGLPWWWRNTTPEEIILKLAELQETDHVREFVTNPQFSCRLADLSVA
ncbi:hypothetical protein SORBI_3006G045400 [Sorghum bicolor]|uniref:Uncharacterized protein n=1 Tax=Sorghum bicolor TaxID=4558 RepID=A0A1Z5RD86_SORBI|nr:hypothetical protein SORBI_3006G045400 [Sorghum bicolor]